MTTFQKVKEKGFTSTPKLSLLAKLTSQLRSAYAGYRNTLNLLKGRRQRRTEYWCRGFTLIEIVLYLTLMTVMVAVLGGIGINVLQSNAKAHALEEIGYNAQFIFGKLDRTISEAESIDLENGATSSTLSLTFTDPNRDPTVFGLANGIFTMTEGSATSTDLSTHGVTVSNLTFQNVAYSDALGAVRVAMTLEAKNPEGRSAYQASGTFYTTIVLQSTP